MTTPTQSQIRDAIKYMDNLREIFKDKKVSSMQLANFWAHHSETIRTILQSALDTQKPAGDVAISSQATLDSFEIMAEGTNTPIVVEGETRFIKEKDFIHYKSALAGDCCGGDHPQIEGLEAAINNSIMYPMVNDVGFQSEHDRRVVMQAARRYLALTADNAKRGE